MSALSRMAAIFGIAQCAPNPLEIVRDGFCGTNRIAEKNRKRKNIANRKRKAQKAARRRNRR